MPGPNMLAPNNPAILFDLDGTLIDSVYQHVMSWREAFAQNHIYLPVWKIHRRIGMSGQLFVPVLLREMGHRTSTAQIEKLEKRQVVAFEKKIKEIQVLPGSDDLLRGLSRRGIRWAIASGGNRNQVEKLLSNLEIPASTPVITGDDVKKAKPAPDIFFLAAEKLGVKLSESVVVGDSPWDLLAARRMKALGIGLLSGGYAKEELESAGAHRVYESPLSFLQNLADIGIYPDR